MAKLYSGIAIIMQTPRTLASEDRLPAEPRGLSHNCFYGGFTGSFVDDQPQAYGFSATPNRGLRGSQDSSRKADQTANAKAVQVAVRDINGRIGTADLDPSQIRVWLSAQVNARMGHENGCLHQCLACLAGWHPHDSRITNSTGSTSLMLKPPSGPFAAAIRSNSNFEA